MFTRRTPVSSRGHLYMLGAEHATLAQRLRARVSVPVRDATLPALLCYRLALHTWKRLPAMPGAKLRAVAERRSLSVRHRAEHKTALVLCRPPRAPCARELVHEVVRASRAALTQWRCVRASQRSLWLKLLSQISVLCSAFQILQNVGEAN